MDLGDIFKLPIPDALQLFRGEQAHRRGIFHDNLEGCFTTTHEIGVYELDGAHVIVEYVSWFYIAMACPPFLEVFQHVHNCAEDAAHLAFSDFCSSLAGVLNYVLECPANVAVLYKDLGLAIVGAAEHGGRLRLSEEVSG